MSTNHTPGYAVHVLEVGPVSIDTLGLTPRVRNSLKRKGINTLEELWGYTDKRLLGLRNIGPVAVAEIRAKLTESDRQERLAQSCLAASAPELLEVLEEIVTTIEHEHLLFGLMIRARAVINKAKGG